MIFDLVVLGVLLISAGIAFFRGFIREVLTILGVVGGLVAAYFGGPLLAPMVNGWFDHGTEEHPKKLLDMIPYEMVADAIAYGGVFIVVVIVLSVASHFLAGWARAIGLGAVDRTLGVIFGLARGVIIIALLYLPVSIIVDKETLKQTFKDSKTHFYIAGTADWMMTMVPDSFKDDMEKKAGDTADSVAKATREKFQEMDVLGGDAAEELKKFPAGESESPAEGGEIYNSAPAEPPPGYDRGERQDMNDLIRKQMNE